MTAQSIDRKNKEPSPTQAHLQVRGAEAGKAVPLRQRAQLAQALSGGGGEADLALYVYVCRWCTS